MAEAGFFGNGPLIARDRGFLNTRMTVVATASRRVRCPKDAGPEGVVHNDDPAGILLPAARYIRKTRDHVVERCAFTRTRAADRPWLAALQE